MPRLGLRADLGVHPPSRGDEEQAARRGAARGACDGGRRVPAGAIAAAAGRRPSARRRATHRTAPEARRGDRHRASRGAAPARWPAGCERVDARGRAAVRVGLPLAPRPRCPRQDPRHLFPASPRGRQALRRARTLLLQESRRRARAGGGRRGGRGGCDRLDGHLRPLALAVHRAPGVSLPPLHSGRPVGAPQIRRRRL